MILTSEKNTAESLSVAPLGAFGAISLTVGKYGIGSLIPLFKLILTFYVTAFVFVAVVLGAVARMAGFTIAAVRLRTCSPAADSATPNMTDTKRMGSVSPFANASKNDTGMMPTRNPVSPSRCSD
ncbi:C4-dicarboxylate transporter DctA [Caballeronia catudaia]|uniref:C4-dicarboxylate transporter DctA n=1 Tax=Caballeronia catudaia TaxID=1777136 RepID=A0A158CHU5_9BURK|nr:C4-dicarboxylate transporter DctA [Caballeronia catudaia]